MFQENTVFGTKYSKTELVSFYCILYRKLLTLGHSSTLCSTSSERARVCRPCRVRWACPSTPPYPPGVSIHAAVSEGRVHPRRHVRRACPSTPPCPPGVSICAAEAAMSPRTANPKLITNGEVTLQDLLTYYDKEHL